MPLSFQQHTANGSTTVFDASQIDGYLSVSDIYVYVNDVQKTVGVHYSLQTSPSLQITFLPGNTPALKDEVRIQRITPNTVSGRSVDFADGSVLNANDLDKSALQLLYITQEAEDTGSGALGKQFDQLSWNAEGLPITSAATGGGSDSLTTKGYVDTLALYGGGAVNPQAWTFSGDNVLDTFTLSPVANADHGLHDPDRQPDRVRHGSGLGHQQHHRQELRRLQEPERERVHGDDPEQRRDHGQDPE